MAELRWRHVGLISYGDALELQRSTHTDVVERDGVDHLFTLEHHPVITLGKRASEHDVLIPRDALRDRGVEVFDVDRGGEATYHGPGQLVVYAVVNLKRRGIGVGDLVRGLAASIADVLATMGIDADYDTDRPGLWTGGSKITAVGMRITRGASMHGAALNVTTNLDAFSLIVPCGMPEATTTSIAQLGVTPPAMDELGRLIAFEFAKRFGYRIIG